MTKDSRVLNSIRNSTVAIICQAINIVLQFIARTVFIRTLGIEYLGVNGVFTNILSILSLTELGIGGVIVFSMYKPLAEEDNETLGALVNLYRKIYVIIGSIIFVLGLLVVPFLHLIIKDAPSVTNLKFIFFLFLINSVSTYFFAHYGSILTADQKEYVNIINRTIFWGVQVIIQIIILLLFKSFVLYLTIQIICNFAMNYLLSLKVKKMYPHILKNSKMKLENKDVKNIFKNSIAMITQKMGYVILNSTDNVVISSFIGSMAVGIYSNYLLIIGTVSTLINIIVMSIGASVGNLLATSEKSKNNDIFLKLNFMYFWIYSFCSICLFILLSHFITIWLGKEFILNNVIVLVITLNFYINGMRQVVLTFTNAAGLFWEMRFKPIFEVTINLFVSIVLVKYLGILGVFLGTLISLIITSIWYEPYILYKNIFNKNCKEYFKRYSYYFFILVITTLATSFICRFIDNYSIKGLIYKMIICMIIPNLTVAIIFGRSLEFKYFLKLFKTIIIKKVKINKVRR